MGKMEGEMRGRGSRENLGKMGRRQKEENFARRASRMEE